MVLKRAERPIVKQEEARQDSCNREAPGVKKGMVAGKAGHTGREVKTTRYVKTCRLIEMD